MQIRVVVRPAIEDQQASLRGDRDAYLVRDLLAGATGESLLGNDQLNVAIELALEIGGEQAEVGNAAVEDFTPGGGEGTGADVLAAALDPERLGDDPGNEEGEEGGEEEGHVRSRGCGNAEFNALRPPPRPPISRAAAC